MHGFLTRATCDAIFQRDFFEDFNDNVDDIMWEKLSHNVRFQKFKVGAINKIKKFTCYYIYHIYYYFSILVLL
jgi:hypothetical protein